MGAMNQSGRTDDLRPWIVYVGVGFPLNGLGMITSIVLSGLLGHPWLMIPLGLTSLFTASYIARKVSKRYERDRRKKNLAARELRDALEQETPKV